jgi:hypothetical protein
LLNDEVRHSPIDPAQRLLQLLCPFFQRPGLAPEWACLFKKQLKSRVKQGFSGVF